ncbi:MAG: hypothetical protein ACREE6_10130 [Limisphaerales bacterium]
MIDRKALCTDAHRAGGLETRRITRRLSRQETYTLAKKVEVVPLTELANAK